MTKHKVTLWPEVKVVEIDEKTPLMQALKENGINIKSSCGGMATCRDCLIKIRMGEDNLMPPTFPELKLLGNVFHITKERLSCQTKICGDVTIDISNHDQSPGGDRVTPKSMNRPRKIPTKLRKKGHESTPTPSATTAAARASANTANKATQGETPWFRHWENSKKDSPGNAGDGDKNNAQEGPENRDFRDERTRGNGGGKRPKTFQYNEEEDKDPDKK